MCRKRNLAPNRYERGSKAPPDKPALSQSHANRSYMALPPAVVRQLLQYLLERGYCESFEARCASDGLAVPSGAHHDKGSGQSSVTRHAIRAEWKFLHYPVASPIRRIQRRSVQEYAALH